MSEIILFHEGLDGGMAAPFDPDNEDRDEIPVPGRIGAWPCLRQPAPDLPASVYVCGLCASSLDVARALADRNLLPAWSSVLALGQTAGRGQLGRIWRSEPGNVFAALRLPLDPALDPALKKPGGSASAPPASPFAGPEAAPALGALLAAGLRDCGYPVLLKWPNDMAVSAPDGTLRKAGGILLEERRGILLAGIGLNLAGAPPPEALREGHALPAGCLVRHPARPCPAPSPLALWPELVTRMKFWHDDSPHAGGSGGFAARWRALAENFLAWSGREAGIVDGRDEAVRLRGIVTGLSPDGGLRLRARGVTHTAHSGSLVPWQKGTVDVS